MGCARSGRGCRCHGAWRLKHQMHHVGPSGLASLPLCAEKRRQTASFQNGTEYTRLQQPTNHPVMMSSLSVPPPALAALQPGWRTCGIRRAVRQKPLSFVTCHSLLRHGRFCFRSTRRGSVYRSGDGFGAESCGANVAIV